MRPKTFPLEGNVINLSGNEVRYAQGAATSTRRRKRISFDSGFGEYGSVANSPGKVGITRPFLPERRVGVPYAVTEVLH